MPDTAIDVEKIMQDIREEIKAKGLSSAMLSFEDVPFDKEVGRAQTDFRPEALQQSAEYLSIRSQLEPYKPIEGSFRFFKRVLRKLMKFFIMPLVTEQNAVNYHCANAVGQLNAYVRSTAQVDTAELAARVEALELRQAASREEITALRHQVEALTAENEALRRDRA